MSKPVSTTVKCQDPGDGSGDVIIDLPQDVLKALKVELGDLLSVELVNGPIELRPIRAAAGPSHKNG
ncbi:AbrB/MazE/SpoVT family DNA-binding domain-containing protein [Pseudomonas putida]|uniref:AbrB/MazE/SpoVT family DNA-binding domain-containing protein n=1 Tax=Pseudomonas putida TaxID=303 RepID=UPI0018D7E3F4|nr:AbrB/MazE/SpoVT family DNA-binding domain-containing protein [Pseudomonas putida]MBH3471349.1 AbrB/MazE/SpoVT family DNA-binding domain-containing protein [Pseudomonas putida]